MVQIWAVSICMLMRNAAVKAMKMKRVNCRQDHPDHPVCHVEIVSTLCQLGLLPAQTFKLMTINTDLLVVAVEAFSTTHCPDSCQLSLLLHGFSVALQQANAVTRISNIRYLVKRSTITAKAHYQPMLSLISQCC